jgi:site-specific DNA recombinase
MTGATMPACVIYGAKSTEDVHGSIPTQLTDCQEMATRYGWEVVAEHSDEAFSAFHGNRGPGLEQAKADAIAAAAERGSCILVAQDADRFARGAGDAPGAADHLGEVYFALRRQSVELWSVRSGKLDLLRAALEGERATDESARKSQTVKAGMRRRAEAGKLAGGQRPYGYRWSSWLDDSGRKQSKLAVVPAEAEIVRRIYRDTVDGVGQRQLVRSLAAEGIKSATGRKWGQASISVVLSNPLYRGDLRHGREVYAGAHEAIVSPELWAAAERARSSRVRRAGGRRARGSHLLVRGLLRCGRCGEAMIPRTQTNRGGSTYERYLCRGHVERGIDFCSQRPIPRQVIDEAMLRELTTRYLDLDATRERFAERQVADLAIARDALAHAETEAQRADAAMQRVRSDYVAGELTAAEWRDFSAELTDGLTAASEAVNQARGRVAAIEAAGDVSDAEATLLEQLAVLKASVAGSVDRAPDLDALRNVLGSIIERVEIISSDRPFGHSYHGGGIIDHRDGESLSADEYSLLVSVRVDAFDLDSFAPKRIPLPAVETDQEGLSSTSSAPRSNSRTRCSSSLPAVSTSAGVSGELAGSSPSRNASNSSSVRPLTSTTSRSIGSWDSRARVASVEPAVQAQSPSAFRLSARNRRVSSSSSAIRITAVAVAVMGLPLSVWRVTAGRAEVSPRPVAFG